MKRVTTGNEQVNFVQADSPSTGFDLAYLTGRRKWLLILGLYLTQYVGQGFLLIALISVLRRHGAPVSQLGLVYLTGVCWVFKFLWAPIIDRFRVGRTPYRGWLLITQSGMLVTLLAIGFFDPIIDFYAILALGVLHSFFASTQDVAGDGLVRRILAPHERPTGMSVQAAAGLIGNILGGGLVMAAYPHIGWRGCTTILMFAVAACLVQVTLFKEPPDLDRQPQVSPKRIISFWKEPGNFAWLALMAPFCLGVGLGWGALPVLMTDRGFGYEQIGLTLNGIGSFAGLIGAIIFGAVMRRSPRSRMLNLMGWSLIGSYGLVFLLVTSFKANSAFIAAVQVYFLGTSASMVLIPTIMLDRASKSTPATDFTIQFCALTVFQHLGGGLATVIVGLRGPVGILFFPMVLAAAGLFLGRLFLGKGLLSLDQALESEGERFEVEREMRK